MARQTKVYNRKQHKQTATEQIRSPNRRQGSTQSESRMKLRVRKERGIAVKTRRAPSRHCRVARIYGLRPCMIIINPPPPPLYIKLSVRERRGVKNPIKEFISGSFACRMICPLLPVSDDSGAHTAVIASVPPFRRTPKR